MVKKLNKDIYVKAKALNANNDPARLTTNRMTDKAANNGYDAVLFKDIYDSANEETSRIVSSILSIINNRIIDNVNVLSNSEIDKRLGNDILEYIVHNSNEFSNNKTKSFADFKTLNHEAFIEICNLAK